MRRRQFIAGLGSAAAWPVVARVQPDRMRRVGLLMGFDENDPIAKTPVSAFTKALVDLGLDPRCGKLATVDEVIQ